MKRFHLYGLAYCLFAGQAAAAPVSLPAPGPLALESGTYTRFFNQNVGVAYLNTSDQTQDYTFADGTKGSGRASLATGEVGVKGTSDVDSNTTASDFSFFNAQLFDVVEFDFGAFSSGLVTLSLGVEGVLRVGSRDGYVIGSHLLRVFDVTDLANPFRYFSTTSNSTEPGAGLIIANNSVGQAFPSGAFFPSASNRVLRLNDQVIASTSMQTCQDYISEGFPCATTVSGQSVSYQRVLSGSFTATEGRSYAILLETGVFTEGVLPGTITGDLYGTSVFRFTDTSGGTYTSSSGELLTKVGVAPVPLPASLTMLSAALITFLLGGSWSRRRKSVVG